jgi:hypothetical protein
MKSSRKEIIKKTEQERIELESTFESSNTIGLREFFNKELESINKLIRNKLKEHNVQEFCINLIVTNYRQDKTANPVFVPTDRGFMIASKENT